MAKIKSNELDAIFEIVQIHAGTGNSTWIFEAAKQNPKCNIMCASNVLAINRKKEFETWFIKTNGREPKQNETPHFFGIWGVFYHAKYGNRVPLILDNSCFDTRFIEKYHDIISEHTFERAEQGFRKHLTKYDNIISDIEKLIYTRWFIFRNKWWKSRIRNIKAKY